MYVVHYSDNAGCCRSSVASWITVLSQHTVFTIGVVYKFILVWHSMKQGPTHRPTSHLAHLYTEFFLWPWDEHRWQRSWVDDFTGQCCYRTFVAAALGLPTNWEVEQSWLLPASSIKFLTRRSLKSRWVYLAPHEDKSIQVLLSTTMVCLIYFSQYDWHSFRNLMP